MVEWTFGGEVSFGSDLGFFFLRDGEERGEQGLEAHATRKLALIL